MEINKMYAGGAVRMARITHNVMQQCRSALLALGAVVIAGCASEPLEYEEGEPLSTESEAVAQRGWYSLAAANHNINMDVGIHLACSGDPNGTADQVLCFRPTDDWTFVVATQTIPTNWGTPPTNGVYRIPGGRVKSVTLQMRREALTVPNAGVYKVYVLSADNKIRYTEGRSDHDFTGQDFKAYNVRITNVSTDGQTLSFRKIMFMNEGSLGSITGREYLFAITNDDKLYKVQPGHFQWTLHAVGIVDMGHSGAIGATFLNTSGQVWYDAFSDDPYDYSGLLPVYPDANITAVGGLYALTDSGKGGNCTTSGCSGDDKRIIHFSWAKWKWEPLQELIPPDIGTGYFPIAAPQTCADWDRTSTCSPLVRDSIIDPHGFGSTMADTVRSSFDVGPFVGRAGSRVYTYNPAGWLPKPFHACRPVWRSQTKTYDYSSCGCQQQEDTSRCEPTVGGFVTKPKACLNGSCKFCGGAGQPCCVGRTCRGGSTVCASTNICVPVPT